MKDNTPAPLHKHQQLQVQSQAVKRGLDRLGKMSCANLGAGEIDRLPRKVAWVYSGYGDKNPTKRGLIRRPPTAPVVSALIPSDLKDRRQWVGWDWSLRDYGWGKPPLSPVTKGGAFEDDPATWSSFEQALAFAHLNNLPGVGYVFSGDDPFAGVDIDQCRDPKTSEVDGASLSIIFALDSYSEVSPSLEGVHIVVRGSLEESFDRKKKVLPERFDRDHYFTMTGMHLPETPQAILPRQKELRSLPKTPPDKTYSDTGTNKDEPSIRGLVCLGEHLMVWRWDGWVEILDVFTGVSTWQESFDYISSWASSPGHVLFISADIGIIAIEMFSGTQLWRTELDGFPPPDSMYAHGDKLILYEASTDPGFAIQVMSANTGNVLWTFDADQAQFDELIDTSIFDGVICVTGYNEEDGSDADELFHSVALDISTGIPRMRVQISGTEMVIIDDLYAGWIDSRLHKRWSEFDRNTRGVSTRHGLVMKQDDSSGLACYDAHTDEELWSYKRANTDFPFIATQELVYASLADDAASIVAISAESGVELWSSETRRSGWAYPVHATSEAVFVLERTLPHLYCLSAQSGDLLWKQSLTDVLDTCLDAERRLLNIGSQSRNLNGLIVEGLLVLRTGHIACAIQLAGE